MRTQETPHRAAMLFLIAFSALPAEAQTVSETEAPAVRGGEQPRLAPARQPWDKPSDADELRLPAEWLNARPIAPPPLVRQPLALPGPLLVEKIDLRTGEISRYEPAPLEPMQEGAAASAPAFRGLLPYSSSPTPLRILGDDDRVRVSPTTGFPWRTVCQLFITFPDGTQVTCSGALVGRSDGHGFHVLTAGHCVYNSAHGGWASSVEVAAGLDGSYAPFGRAYATTGRTYTGWTDYSDANHDWALLTLDRSLGTKLGWMGRITRSSSDSLYRGALNSAGYPGDRGGGVQMYFDAAAGRTANEFRHWYFIDTAGGQSGMPVWMYFPSDAGDIPAGRYISTVHARGGNASSGNSGTRLNRDKFDRLVSWTNADGVPNDRADLLDDGDRWSGFSHPSVVSGQTSVTAWADVRNIGTASSGSFRVTYYASTNDFISEFDYVLGSDVVSSISPFNWRDTSWSGVVPADIPTGRYYIGWIIDSDDGVSEFKESNNAAVTSGRVDVVQPPALEPPGGGMGGLVTTPSAVQGEPLVLAVHASDPASPDGFPPLVAFHHDADGDGVFGAADPLIAADADPSGGWSVQVDSSNFEVGEHTFFARAQSAADSAVWSDPLAIAAMIEPAPCLGDLNSDGNVDGGDLGDLILAWGPAPEGAPADLDQTAVIDGADLGRLLLLWGPCSQQAP